MPEGRFQDAHFVRHVWLARTVLVLTALALILWQSAIDEAMRDFWSWLRVQWWFKHDSFEPMFATFSFALWLNLFGFVDAVLPLKAYLIDPSNRKVDHHTGLPYRAGAVYLGVLLVFDVLYPRRSLPEAAPYSIWHVLWGVVAALFTYDLLFFPVHLCMHRVHSLRRIHTMHHANKQALFSTDVLRHSLPDGALQVATNIVTLNLLRLHPLTRALYNAVVTYLLTEIHSGYDLPCMMHNVLPRGVMGGSVRHEEHHRDGKRFFQQFFCYLDDNMLSSG